jgi:outer membrane protein OmpA-like peptidoglycan-associated protein
MKHIKLLMTIALVSVYMISEAQVGSYFTKFRPSKKWSVGLQISPTGVNGDADDIKIAWAFGGHVKYSVSQTFGLKLSGNIGTLRGGRAEQDVSGNRNDGRNGATTVSDQSSSDGNKFNTGNQAPSEDSYIFTNNFRDLNVTTVFTLGNLSFLRPLRKLQLFTIFGFGTIWSDVQGEFEDSKDANSYYSSWGDEFFEPVTDASGAITNAKTRFKGRNFTLPFGVGVKRDFGRFLDLGVEWKSHYTRGDALDGFSFPVWRNRYADFYHLLSFQASIKLGAKGEKEHYDWLNPLETIYKDLDSLKILGEKIELVTEDDDEDGVPNYFDKEPGSKTDKVYGNGVAIDIDDDGIPDFEDDEPFSEKGATVNGAGVMIDIDKDGIPDYRDEEKSTPVGALVDGNGKEVKVRASGGSCCDCEDVVLPAVIFDAGSSRIKPEFYSSLYAVASKMKQCPDLMIVASGYSTGKSGEQLSFKRATAIIQHLNSNYGIDQSRVGIDYSTFGGSMEFKGRRIDLRKGSGGSVTPPHPGM